MSGVILSPPTAAKLKILLDATSVEGGGYTKGSGTRQICHVLVSSDTPTDGWYPCNPAYYDAEDDALKLYADSWVKDLNGTKLQEDTVYFAARTGDVEGEAHYLTDVSLPPLGCYLKINEDGELTISTDTLLGKGLKLDDDSISSTCDPITLDIGCGLDFDGNKLVVDLETMAGDGLIADETSTSDDCGTKLNVNVGCGLAINDYNEVEIDTEESSTDGPTVVGEIEFTPVGCGFRIQVVPYTIKTNACGVFIGFERGDTITHNVSLTACCDCSDDSSDDSSSSDDPPDECTGWYCDDATGNVIYLANCAEVTAFNGTPCYRYWDGETWVDVGCDDPPPGFDGEAGMWVACACAVEV